VKYILSRFTLIAISTLFLTSAFADSLNGVKKPSPPNASQLEWWRHARFGMFIHWGPVSLTGKEIGWSRGAETPIDVYDNLYKHFDPVKFNPGKWAAIARSAGMKYIVLTTKHHDGFCLWDTKQTDYNIMHSPFHRDIVRELSAACKEQGMAFGAYYSVCDWHNPDFVYGSPGGQVRNPHPDMDAYTAYMKSQLKELITQYGPLLLIWFDNPQGFTEQRGKSVVDYVRSLQPDIIVNNRCAVPGDYDTPEQHIGGFQLNRPWETCMTICQQWSWKPNDTLKSLQECIQTLARCAGGDGNLLLNVGPEPNGEIEPRQAERLQEIGKWLKRNGVSIYDTRGGPFMPASSYVSTRRGNLIFLHILTWPGETLELPPLPCKILAASLLEGGKVHFTQSDDSVSISIPQKYRDANDTVVKLQLIGSAMDISPIHPLYAIKATASNVYQNDPDFGPEMAVDGDMNTRWATDAGVKQAWILLDMGKMRTIHHVDISEAYPGRVRRFEIQCKDEGEWKSVIQGDVIGADYHADFPPVSARFFRLNILDATDGPTIYEVNFK
jgi:alpha-L-fucosidase